MPGASTNDFAAPDPAELNKLLPAYEVKQLIATGGMGAVYLARQKSLDRNIAIKVLPREFGADPTFRASFESEAKAMAKLRHPNLIGVHDFGEVEGYLYLTMDFVDGKSLFHSARGKAIAQKTSARVVCSICEGLAHAHEAGIVHRDIKPANILIGSDKEPRIGDFGLARPVDGTGGSHLNFATPEYAAPEVMKDPAVADKRSDVYATGVILYELLTGDRPGRSYRPPSQTKSQKVDARFDKIVRRAMHPAPGMRYADAEEMLKELQALSKALGEPGSRLTDAPPARLQTADDTQTAPDNGGTAIALTHAAANRQQKVVFRNLIIIAILLVTIVLVLSSYNRKKIENARDQSRPDLNKALGDDPDNLYTPPTQNSGTPTRVPEPPPQPPVNPNPLTLAALKKSLASGDRSRFPGGSWDLGKSDKKYYFVKKPLSWRNARKFAEDHGAHLATVSDDQELSTLQSKLPGGTPVWLGGGITGPTSWGWVDGIPWNLSSKPSDPTGRYLILTTSGSLRAIPGNREEAFVLQWHSNGRNPGSLGAQLARLKNSLEDDVTLYPPGTLTQGERHFLIQEEQVNWKKAVSLAENAGGHLAVPASKAENDFLQQVVNTIFPSGTTVWLGGHYTQNSWHWLTGETWIHSAWSPSSKPFEPSHTALCLLNGDQAGWSIADPSTKVAAAYIIEWSSDHKSPPAPKPTLSPDWTRIQRETNTEVTLVHGKYLKDIQENGTNLNRALATWYNELDRQIKGRYQKDFERAREQLLRDGRIEDKGPGPRLPANLGSQWNNSLETQRTLDRLFKDRLVAIRADYLKSLDNHLQRARADRLLNQVEALESEITAIGKDTASLLAHFSSEE